MNKTIALFHDLCRDQSGATAVEYGLISALIAVTILGAIAMVGGGVEHLFTGVANSANGALTDSTGLLN